MVSTKCIIHRAGIGILVEMRRGVRRSFANIEFADSLGANVFGRSLLTRVVNIFDPSSPDVLVEPRRGLRRAGVLDLPLNGAALSYESLRSWCQLPR